MRTSITIATFLVVGAGVAGASALPNPYFGSDALAVITKAAIAASPLGVGDVADYIGGGSGGGATAMAAGANNLAAFQQTAPMSRMIKSEGAVCTVGGFNGQTVAGSAGTAASGIVIGLDGVDLYSSTSTGASIGATACQGTNTTTAFDNAGFGLAFSGTTGVYGATAANPNPAANAKQTWKWALALVYGGFDYSAKGGGPAGVPDCNQLSRRNLVANWNNFFQQTQVAGNTCTANGVAACMNLAPQTCSDGSTGGNATCAAVPVGTAPGTACGTGTGTCVASGPIPLWHAFRLDDDSGTSDVFATILGLSPSVSNSSNNGFGASPYCNAINIDTSAANTSTPCSAGPHLQWTGPGGIIDPVGDGVHRRPPPGVWGDAPDPTQNKKTSADVVATEQQDNDPIRRPCLGGSTDNVNIAGEEVCNLDQALGLVLPLVDTTFFVTAATPGPFAQFPTNPATTFVSSTNPLTVITCPASPASAGGSTVHNAECPNGDALNGAGCQVPIDAKHGTNACPTSVGGSTCTSQAVSSLATVPTIKSSTRGTATTECPGQYGTNPAASLAAGALDTHASCSDGSLAGDATCSKAGAAVGAACGTGGTCVSVGGSCLANQGSPDGRAYNVHAYNGNATNPAYIQATIPAIPGVTFPFAALFNRVHEVETVLGGAGNVGAAAGCQLADSADQIACLAQADPCSIGYAADAGKAIQVAGGPANPGANAKGNGKNGASSPFWTGTTGALGGLDSARAAQVYPSATTVLLLGQAGEYQISRKLYFNSLVGFQNITAAGNDPTAADELTLARFEANPVNMNPIVVANKEFTLGNEFAGDVGLACSDGTTNTCPAPLVAGNPCNAPGLGVCVPTPDPQFCEDFNEQTVCNNTATAPANVNGCAGTPTLLCSFVNGSGPTNAVDLTGQPNCVGQSVGTVCDTSVTPNSVCVAGLPGGAAGIAGSNPGTPVGADQAAGTSTVCGDGIRQAYEECDNGSLEFPSTQPGLHGAGKGNSNSDTAAGGCSLTCRCVNDFVSGACN